MSNKKYRQFQFMLKVFEQIEDRRLHTNIQSTDRLITNQKFWLNSKGTCDANSLPLAPTEFMGIPKQRVWI